LQVQFVIASWRHGVIASSRHRVIGSSRHRVVKKSERCGVHSLALGLVVGMCKNNHGAAFRSPVIVDSVVRLT
jgi:hypothetical protein